MGKKETDRDRSEISISCLHSIIYQWILWCRPLSFVLYETVKTSEDLKSCVILTF